ncbi:dTDP-4-dehydrorhamnose 3,5-epimerase [Candidatus Thiosymbion oneisti]|uniref:dTDP-4-dehydrorhamnose 3,5-epimerase n=1 Tax=Candidatus Thiosymbion oneisti TaxID=589554 RepID=UPI000AA74FB0|nr:dTDP-4-dehydrorhamnose 3,5-epimerase [Candidatus Thiosymbion oneisti]
MKVIVTELPGVLILEPKVFGDERGFFMETYRRDDYARHGIPRDLVQDNLSYSRRGVLRGLHLQWPHPQGKLVQVFSGEVFDVAVDVRRGSPTFGRWVGVHLSGENKRQFWVPTGFAHGFYVASPAALFAYKCSDFYYPETERCVRWDDPDIGIDWPLDGQPDLSPKDLEARLLRDVPAASLPVYKETASLC